MIEVTFTILPVATACGMLALSEDAKFFVEKETERKNRWEYWFIDKATIPKSPL
jgi:hypothetical protein